MLLQKALTGSTEELNMILKELATLKEQLESLANSKDPKTGLVVEDTILRSSYNKRILENAASVIGQLITIGSDPTSCDPRKKRAFFLTEEEKNRIVLSEKPISISAFTYTINSVIDQNKKKKLQAVQITSWLMSEGYLDEFEDDDWRKFKVVTQKASEIGITAEQRQSPCGRVYQVNLYDRDAQTFILNHIDEIILHSQHD